MFVGVGKDVIGMVDLFLVFYVLIIFVVFWYFGFVERCCFVFDIGEEV